MKNLFSILYRNICSNALKRTGILNLLLVALCFTATAQSGKNLALAEKYFAAGDYYTAAGLYEQYLHPAKRTAPRANLPLNSKRFHRAGTSIQLKNIEVLYRQAHSYRLAHYLSEAAERYKNCYEKDSVQYADAIYWYAVCKRGLGDYKEAESFLNKYLVYDYGHNNYTEQAKLELETINYINSQLKRPDLALYKIALLKTSFGSGKGVYAPALVADNEFVFTSTETDTSSGVGENPYHNRMYNAVINNNSIEVNGTLAVSETDSKANQGTASVSANGKYLYFTQWNKAGDKYVSSIYYCVKAGNHWNKAQPLLSVNLTGFNNKQPYCSADGKYLFFASDRKGGAGGFDIWYAPLNADGTAGLAENITAVNTKNNEQAPFFHTSSNTLVFSSDRNIGMGGYDLFTANWKDGQWSAPKNMGYPVNSSRDDIYFFASEGNALLNNALLSSDRGAGCCLETYLLSKKPKKRYFAGYVLDSKNHSALENAVVVMKGPDGNKLQATTDKNGKYGFEIRDDIKNNKLEITRDKYKDKKQDVKVEKVDESDWSADFYENVPVLMDKKLVIKPETVVTVYFDFDKYDLKSHSVHVLDSIYTVLKNTPAATIQISGYTDGRGTEDYNKVLSDKRARACADYLIAKGIDASRITFESFGMCCPIEMELINGRDNPDGRSKNRRALINITME
ncbi:MAG: OmpA family protein [Sphingobacteriales bacterium]|nr:OmpA family protein [Sphingobacteriales bacterium]MBI3719203.1 OmpA family protein [Sphingobacteriales bacterium]